MRLPLWVSLALSCWGLSERWSERPLRVIALGDALER
jgi:hypothetical protein